MALSNQSMNRIAAAMVQEVVDELMDTGEWMDFLHTNIGGIIVDKIGQIDDEVLAELIMCVSDRIGLKAYTNLD
jgi:hypothetical protein